MNTPIIHYCHIAATEPLCGLPLGIATSHQPNVTCPVCRNISYVRNMEECLEAMKKLRECEFDGHGREFRDVLDTWFWGFGNEFNEAVENYDHASIARLRDDLFGKLDAVDERQKNRERAMWA